MLSPVPLPLQIATGFLIALTIGLTGVGGGTITVPVLVLFMGVPAAPAVGTALAFSALVKIPAALVYLRQGKIDFGVLRWTLLGGVPGLVAGGVPGAILGARLASVLPTRTLRIALLVWLVFLGTQLLYRGVDALSAATVHPW